MHRFLFVVLLVMSVAATAYAQGPEPANWYAGDMHVHRSCGASPEAVSSVKQKMDTQNLAAISLLADMGNGEVQDPASDLPQVNGTDDPSSTAGRIVHWDAEWHWDATYTSYPHQALGGHILSLGLKEAHQIWEESTSSIFNWAHQQNAIAGFAHMQYLGTDFPQALNCCIPMEYPVEVGLGSADFISEDVDGSETAIQAYYRLLNSGFRPGFAAGTDYPCNSSAGIGSPLTYVRVPSGQMNYRNWIDGISNGMTVVSRNGHNEFLDLKVNSTAMPGDQINLTSAGTVQVNVQWTANQSITGTIELVSNGVVIASKQASVSAGSPATLTATVNFDKSGWLAARRTGTNGHVVHTAAVFVIVNGAPIRANAADPQFLAQWMDSMLTNTSPGGVWNWYFPTTLSATQTRYQAAKSLYQQIALEAQGSGPALSSLAITPASQTVAPGNTQQFTATGTYANGSTLNITGQARWSSSNASVARVNQRGLVYSVSAGTTTITATLGAVTNTASLTVQAQPLTITTTTLADGTQSQAYTAHLAASGGIQPFSWAPATGSTLPSGLSLSTTGDITGTPTAAGTTSFTVQVTDSIGAQATRALSLKVNPVGVSNYTLWSSATVPGTVDSGPDSAVELGVKFRADVAGNVVGIRFYKAATNTGTHIANLWSSTGTNLASTSFTGETASGWQQVNFASPVAIAAGTVYVASYHTNTGHYSDDTNYFSTKGVDNPPLHALQDGVSGGNGVYAYGSSSSFPSGSWYSSNYWVDVVFVPTGTDTTPPTVTSVTPANGASGVDVGSALSIAFSEAVNPATVTSSTVTLLDSSNASVSATVSYNSGTNTASLKPASALQYSSTYRIVVKGGTTDPRIKDAAGNALASDFTSSFTTAAPPPPPPTDGPGGPILVIATTANPFSRYYGEILRAEGLNEFAIMDISVVTRTILDSYDVVILGDTALTASQVSMLTGWVQAGGNLIAMKPDKQLAGLLGLTDAGSTLSNAYLTFNTASGPGAGLVSQSIQFHGIADRYTLNGATTLATLYYDAANPTANPAVSLIQAGLGQAAAFSYDLAKSVVYTRQGNPAWSGQNRDGQSGPMRANDLFYGAASFDPQPDWVNLSKVAIPQADEQQRLLANLILQMNRAKRPLPRFWYFPNGHKAAVVLTGDDHGALYGGLGYSSARFDELIAASSPGCSVANWECARGTTYIVAPSVAANALTNAQAQAYVAQGFEVSVHGDSVPSCSDWTPSELDSFYTTQIASFANKYTSIPAPKTHRMHCIGWSDYDSQPKAELQHGIRLDTDYYYWPGTWVNNAPGVFTGSGMPMRFTDRNGNMIDVYQATTQMTDESDQDYPYTIDTLLDNALGSAGYYGFFTANIHVDSDYTPYADSIIASAKSRAVPIISAAQLLTWLDGRNASSFGAIAWNSGVLSFTIAVGAGANGLQAMLPASSPSGDLLGITLNGSAVPYATQTIKGVPYAVFSATAGSYQARYSNTPAVALSTLTANPASVTGGGSSTATVTLNGPAPAGGATITISTNNSTATTVPSSVSIAAGSTTGTFTVNTNTVAAATAVTVTASYAGSNVSTLLSVNPSTGLSSLTLNPTALVGGRSSTGTVTLASLAPTGGIVVQLSSANTVVAAVPATVTVAAGSTTARFTITTTAVSASTAVVITASTGVPKTATLTVNPPSFSRLTLSPTAVTGGSNSTGTVTLDGPAPSGGIVLSLASSNTAAATVPQNVTIPAGSSTAAFPITTAVVAASTTSSISATYGTVTRSATLTVRAAALSTLRLNPSSVKGGLTSTGTVTLTGPARAGGVVVTLTSGNSKATVPSTVTVPAGAQSATFTITTATVTSTLSTTIRATYLSVSRSATLTITP